jgi:hypothetical protein
MVAGRAVANVEQQMTSLLITRLRHDTSASGPWFTSDARPVFIQRLAAVGA